MKIRITKLLSAFTAAFCIWGSFTCNAHQNSIITANAADDWTQGEVNGYNFEAWNQNYAGSYDYENTDNNGFSASWSDIVNCFSGKGKKYEPDTISAYQTEKYVIDYDLDVTCDGFTEVGIEGWFSYPDTRFHILEAYDELIMTINPEKLAEVTIDGTTYEIYRSIFSTMFSGPSYPDLWSVAKRDPLEHDKETHLESTIDVAAHFRAWSEAGLDLGYLKDITFGVNAYRCNGSARLNSFSIDSVISDEQVFGPPMLQKPYEPHEPLSADANGMIIKEDLEDESNKTGTEGENASAEITEKHSFSGSHSMYISSADGVGCQPFCYELDPYNLPVRDGEQQFHDYDTGIKIFQNSGDDVRFKVELVTYLPLYPEKGSITQLGTRTCRSGQWTSINNMTFSFKHDVFQKYKIVFTPLKPVNYFADDFYIAFADESKMGKQLFDPVMRGDLNSDGVIDSLDIAVCRKAVLNSLSSDVIDTDGDVNGDYRSNVSDLILLTRYVLNIADDIPLSEDDAEMYIGTHYDYDRTGKLCITIDNNSYNDDSAKSIVRKDGSFRTEWYDTGSFFYERYVDYADTNNKKSSKDFDISYSADVKASGRSELLVRGLIQRGQKTLYFNVYEGWTNGGFFGNYDVPYTNAELVTLNGTEYYMVKYIDTSEDVINFYRKDDPLSSNETCHIENEFNLREVLDHWGENEDYNDTVIKAGVYMITGKTSGYADFSKLQFTKN